MNKHLITLALLVATPLALAAPDGPIVVKTVAEKEQVVTLADGRKQTKLVPAQPVVPGEQVIYTVTFENVGQKPATDVAIVNPVPEHTTYVAGSAGGPGTEVSFSVDGGRTWGAPEQLKLRAADGTERAATPADYTHVRWVLRNPLTPGAVAFARYRVVVK
jgi:uncharacterized repeat protein (TIGR01451 family)